MIDERGVERIDGADIVWSLRGNGPLAVWCHGLGSSSRGQERAGLFDWSELEAERTLLRYDARGHGHSTGGVDAAEYRWERLAQDLSMLLDRLVPGQTLSGVGSSMGTATLVIAALADPSRFGQLVLTAPSTMHFTRPGQQQRYLGLAEYREAHGHEAFLAYRASFPPAPIFAERDARLEWEVTADRTAPLLRGAAASDYPSSDRLNSIACPTLVLAWSTDYAHPLSAAGILSDAIPGATLEVAHALTDIRSWPSRALAFLATAHATALRT